MPTTKRFHAARVVLLTVLAFLFAAVVSGYLAAWVTVPTNREFVPGTGQFESPAESGLDLPLTGGER